LTRGVYVVAFGPQARTCALRLIESSKHHMPDIPVALCSSEALGPEDVLIVHPDSDVGGRRAKLLAYDLAPPEWDTVLYLDADTEVVAPVYALFDWCERGWEFVICRDVKETLHSFERKNNLDELKQVQHDVGSLWALQYNGGVWAFRRCDATKRLMDRWRAEWEVHAQRDQGAFVRALHADPVRLLVLGNEWNCFPKYTPNVVTAGINHYPGDARRWVGKLPGRIDSPKAWARVGITAAPARECAVRFPRLGRFGMLPKPRPKPEIGEDMAKLKIEETGTQEELLARMRALAPDAPKMPPVKRKILDYQMIALYALAKGANRPGARILEIGTGHGGSGYMLGHAAPLASIVSLTTNPAEKAEAERFWHWAGIGNASVTVGASWDYLETAQGLFDFVFVDGDHNRIARDLPWFDRLKVGGLLLCHDYSPNDSRTPSGIVFEQLGIMRDHLGRPFDVSLIDEGKVGMVGFYRRKGDTWTAA
jgi:predicted O-methyltransferase YrrM